MKLPRRNFLHLATVATVLPAISRFAWAQNYPARPISISSPPTQLRFGARDLTFLGALFLHSIVERLLHGLRRDYWRSLWTRSREGKGKGAGWQLLRSLWDQSFFCFNAIADGSWIEIVRPTPGLSRLSRLRASGQTRLPK
jgi:hypothetical protein